LGKLPLIEIDAPMALTVLEEAQKSRGIATAREARTTLSMIFDYAIARRLLMHNSVRDLSKALKDRPPTRHHPALAFADIGPFLRALSASSVEPVTQAATRLVMLLALRDNTLRTAQWREIDWENATWLCPAEHMKGRIARRKDFATPLPAQALAVLNELHALTGRGPDSFIFAGRGKTGHMSRSTINHAIRAVGFAPATAHGMRSLLGTWAEESGYPRATWKAQLAHVLGDQTDVAYMRSSLWQQRIALLDHWGDIIEAAEKGKKAPTSRNVARLRRA